MTTCKLIIAKPESEDIFDSIVRELSKKKLPIYCTEDKSLLLLFFSRDQKISAVEEWATEALPGFSYDYQTSKPRSIKSLKKIAYVDDKIILCSSNGRPKTSEPWKTKASSEDLDYTHPRDTLRMFTKRFGHMIKSSNEEGLLYYWNGARWVREDKESLCDFGLLELFDELFEELRQEKELLLTDPEKLGKTEWEAEALAELLGKHLKSMAFANHFRSFSSLIKRSKAFRAECIEFDKDDHLLNTPDGIIDLQTGDMMEHHPDFLCNKITTARYLPKHTYSEFFEETMNKICSHDAEVVNYLQLRIGSALFGGNVEQKAVQVYGPKASNGKSTLFNALVKAMGDYAQSASPDTFMVGHQVGGNRDDLTRLANARLVVTSEPSGHQALDTSSFKRMTGEDTLVYGAKYERAREIRPTWTLFFLTNIFIPITETGNDIWRRWEVVPFDAEFKYDPEFKDKWEACQDELLTWAIEGAIRWHQEMNQSIVDLPKKVNDAAFDYKMDVDSVHGFVYTIPLFQPDAVTDFNVIYNTYASFCSDRGKYKVKPSNFKLRLAMIRDQMQETGHNIDYHLFEDDGKTYVKGLKILTYESLDTESEPS